MQSTGIFTIHKFEIPFDRYDEPIYLLPFGDVHRSSPMCHVEKWFEWLDWAKRKKRCYLLGMGDYDDLASASERDILTDRKLHDSTHQTIEGLYRKHTERLIKELSFFDRKIVALLEGNHYAEFQNGTTSTQLMCEKLHCKYAGVSTFIRLSFIPTMRRKVQRATMNVDIWAHHGKGAARLVGGSLNRVEQMAECSTASVFLMGHDHKKSVAMKTRLRLVGPSSGELRLSHDKIILGRTGSFLKGYEDGKVSYVADGAMNPTDLGTIKLELTPRRERFTRNGHEVEIESMDLHASI